ncbi:hypothetical protein ACU635_37400 [[Actinomadura] parvosata]
MVIAGILLTLVLGTACITQLRRPANRRRRQEDRIVVRYRRTTSAT